jgi:hypothetical protein
MSLLWKIGGIALACAAAFLLVRMYGGAREATGRHEEAAAWQAKVTEAERGRLVAFQQGLARRDQAETVYRETIRQLPPITNTIVERTTRYAETPAGAARCLEPDRVLGIEQVRGSLFPATAAPATARSAGTLPPG